MQHSWETYPVKFISITIHEALKHGQLTCRNSCLLESKVLDMRLISAGLHVGISGHFSPFPPGRRLAQAGACPDAAVCEDVGAHVLHPELWL